MAPSLNYLTRRSDGDYTYFSHWLNGQFIAERAGLGWVLRFLSEGAPSTDLHNRTSGESRLTDCESTIRALEAPLRRAAREQHEENVRQAREAARIKGEQEREERLRVNSHRDHDFGFILNLDTASAVRLAASLMNRVPSDLSDTTITLRIRNAGGDRLSIDAGLGGVTVPIYDSEIRKTEQSAELIA